MNDELKQYALKILTDAGCDLHTYGGEWSKHIMDDLKQAFPDGMKFPYIDVANAILSMSTPEQIVKAPFHVVWNTDDCCDEYDVESMECGKDSALDTLVNWMCEETEEWKFGPDGTPMPTEEQIESWDYMIFNCYVYVTKYNPEADEYETVWEPSDEELEDIGWHEWKKEK